MTREEELDWLCRLRSEIYVYMPKEWLIPMNNALDMAIKALEQEPTPKNDLGVDCISRAEAIKCLECDFDITGKENMKTVVNYINSAHDKIVNLPRVKQEPKTGHWIIKDGKEQGYDIGGIKTWYIQIMCDKCGFIKSAIEGHTGQYHYCPNCGCRMVEPQESEAEDGKNS